MDTHHCSGSLDFRFICYKLCIVIDTSHLEEKLTKQKNIKLLCTQPNMINKRLNNANVNQLLTTQPFILNFYLMNLYNNGYIMKIGSVIRIHICRLSSNMNRKK